VDSNGPKILFWEWAVKEEIPSPRCLNFLVGIDDLLLKYAQNGRFGSPLTSGSNIAWKTIRNPSKMTRAVQILAGDARGKICLKVLDLFHRLLYFYAEIRKAYS